MDDAEQLSMLIGDIYDAALDSSLWRSVLETTCAYIKGQSGALVAQGPGQSKGHFFSSGAPPRNISNRISAPMGF